MGSVERDVADIRSSLEPLAALVPEFHEIGKQLAISNEKLTHIAENNARADAKADRANERIDQEAAERRKERKEADKLLNELDKKVDKLSDPKMQIGIVAVSVSAIWLGARGLGLI